MRSEGNFTLLVANSTFNAIASADEGYLVIFTNSTKEDSFNNSEAWIVRTGIYAFKKEYDGQFSAPILLYQLPLENITLQNLYCSISYFKLGQVCAFAIKNHTNPPYYVKLNFLSSGSVIGFNQLNFNKLSNVSTDTTGLQIMSVPYGGYFS